MRTNTLGHINQDAELTKVIRKFRLIRTSFSTEKKDKRKLS